MTTAEELALVEAAYQDWLESGMPTQTSQNGRSTIYPSLGDWAKRIDALRVAVSASDPSTGGMFLGSQFRRPE